MKSPLKPPSDSLVAGSAAALTALLCCSILTVSVRERWAVSLLQAGAFGVAIVWAVAMLREPCRLRGSFVLIPLGGTVLWGLAQLALHQTVYHFETRNAVLGWSANLVLFTLSLQVFTVSKLRHRFRRTLAWFGAVLSAVSVLQLYTSGGKIFWLFPTPYTDGVLGPFVSADHYCSFVALVFPLAVGEALRNREGANTYAAMAGIMVASAIASGSRAGAALVTLELIALTAPRLLSRHAPARILLSIAACAALFTAMVGAETLWRRLREPNPYQVRREVLLSTLGMIRDRPVMGFGLGDWRWVYPEYARFDSGTLILHAHNDWAEWTAEGGIPFLLMLLAILLWTLRHSLRAPWSIGLVAVFLHSLVDFPLQKPALAALVFAMLGALAASTSSRASSSYTPRIPCEAPDRAASSIPRSTCISRS